MKVITSKKKSNFLDKKRNNCYAYSNITQRGRKPNFSD